MVSYCRRVREDFEEAAAASEAISRPNKRFKKELPSSSYLEEDETDETASTSLSLAPKASHNKLCIDEDKIAVDKSLLQYLLLNNIPFDIVQTDSFRRFVQAVAECGQEYTPPSYSTFKTESIPDLQMEVEDFMVNVKKSWVTTGCTLMLNLRKDKMLGEFIIVFAYSQKGGMFVDSIEITNKRKEDIESVVFSVIEGIGVDHIVQCITNTTKLDSIRDAVVSKYPRVYVTQCAARAIHILLNDIYAQVQWVRKVIARANLIRTFMHQDNNIILLMKKYTNNKVLKHSTGNMFASMFSMLESIIDVKNELQSLVGSSEWRELDENKEEMLSRVTSIVESIEFWSEGHEVLQVLKPLVRVLQLVESDGMTFGYLYVAMKRAKTEIEQQYSDNQEKYGQIRTLFVEKHFEQIIHPMHSAAAFLNPAYMRNESFKLDLKMHDSLDFVLRNLVAVEEKEAFTTEMMSYQQKVPRLFTESAKIMTNTVHPCLWWDYFRDAVPVLSKYAIRILSQPCSSSLCEQNWSTFETTQPKMSNLLAALKSDSLARLRMNTILMEKSLMREAEGMMPIDLDRLSELSDYAYHELNWDDYSFDATDVDT